MLTKTTSGRYDPKTHPLPTFHDLVPKFKDGTDSPRALLERGLEVIAARDHEVKAMAFLNADAARAAADASTRRYRENRPLSRIDGIALGIKDLMETSDMPTEYGSALYRGNRPIRDAACVYALRKGGAVFVGKTETVCFGAGDPAPTRNPLDLSRTPGGSSAGSAAGVNAGMFPAALGTHARGSTIRPASFCGVFGFKGTFGAINRLGVFSCSHSMDHVGVLAGSLSDVWLVARHAAQFAGGDPGEPGLFGGAEPPAARRPARLIRLDTAGWAEAEDETKAQFESYLGRLQRAGVAIISRQTDKEVEVYERELAAMPQLWRQIYRFEMQWPFLSYLDHDADKLPPRLKKGIQEGAGLTLTEYREGLVKRAYVRGLHEDLARQCDGFITLSSPGPGPVGTDQGSAIFNEGSSVIGMPAVSIPLLSVAAMPVGVQLQGAWHRDEDAVAVARWLAEHELGRSV